MNKNYLLIIVFIIIIGGIYYLEKMKVDPSIADSVENTDQAKLKDGKYPLAPELRGISGYINTKENTKIKDFRGKVVLIDFWTYSCINCIRTLPHLVEWYDKYSDKGLVIIGVHTPEFGFEKKYENVKDAVEKHGVKYPVVQDNDYLTWQAFKNRFWPHKYLIDSEGYIRYDHIGEGRYDETEKQIQKLLDEIGQAVSDMPLSTLEDKTPKHLRQTPELYAGHDFALPRGQNIGNKGGLKPNEVVDYKLPSEIVFDTILLEGPWLSNKDNLQSQGISSIVLSFTAASVNIVADSLNEPLELEVFIGNKYISKDQAGKDVQFKEEKAFILIDKPDLYNIFNSKHGSYQLRLTADSKDFTFNAFTFG